MSASGSSRSEGATRPEEPLWTSDRPEPNRPVLVPGYGGSAILDGTGDLVLNREARGGPSEWGGAYGQDVRLTGPWRTVWRHDGVRYDLPSTLRRISVWRWGTESEHDDGRIRLRQEVATFERTPGVYRQLLLENPGSTAVSVEVESALVPFLAPVILEGVKPYSYRVTLDGPTVGVSSHGSAFLLDTEPVPSRYEIDGARWSGATREGEFRTLSTVHALDIPAGSSSALRWAVTGGTHRWTSTFPDSGKQELRRPVSPLADARARWESWRLGTPEFSCPDEELTRGYRLARDALRSLYSAPEPGFTGLVAGYPWYSALWCRDLAWMLPAVLWLGDHEWARESIETVFRFQARLAIPIMSAEGGELPMEVCPGPIFLFGTSDTTLYYPGIVRRLWQLTGDRSYADQWSEVLDRIAAWAEARCSPTTGLLRNGGEIEGLKDAGATLGRVHFGIDAVDTTIWDSADRRDHAIDIQALGYEAFGALGELAAVLGHADSAEAHRSRAEALAAMVRERYAWPEESYLYDSLRKDGTPVAHLRPNALRAVSVGIVEGDDARQLARRAARSDLSTEWGLRTLSASDPTFDPVAYHEGQVWSIATAWGADSALRAGEVDIGLQFLRTNARRLIQEAGYANECYRGDRGEAFNSCFLLGFSVAPFLTTIFDTLWGLEPQLGQHTVRCAPRFPSSWESAELTGLRLGSGRLSLSYRGGRLDARWEGPFSLTLQAPAASVVLEPGRPESVALSPTR